MDMEFRIMDVEEKYRILQKFDINLDEKKFK